MKGNSGFWRKWAVLLGVVFVFAGNAVANDTGSLSGRVIDSASNAVLGVNVTVNDASGNLAARGTSTQDGSYIVSGLVAGSYKVQFAMSGFVPQWYINKPDFNSADTVSVASSSNTPLSDTVLLQTSIAWGGVWHLNKADGTQSDNLDIGINSLDAGVGNMTATVAGPNGFSYTFTDADVRTWVGGQLALLKEYPTLAPGVYTFTLNDGRGHSSYRVDTHANQLVLPIVDSTTIQNQRKADGSYRFTWAPVNDTHTYYYRLRINKADGSDIPIYVGARKRDGFEDVPAGKMVNGTAYEARVEVIDSSTPDLQFNRSNSAYVSFTPASSDFNSNRLMFQYASANSQIEADGTQKAVFGFGFGNTADAAAVSSAVLTGPNDFSYTFQTATDLLQPNATDFSKAFTTIPAAGNYVLHVVANGLDLYAYLTLTGTVVYPSPDSATYQADDLGNGNIRFSWADVDHSGALYYRVQAKDTVTGRYVTFARLNQAYVVASKTALGDLTNMIWRVEVFDSPAANTQRNRINGPWSAGSLGSIPAFDAGRPVNNSAFFGSLTAPGGGGATEVRSFPTDRDGSIATLSVNGPNGYARYLLTQAWKFNGLYVLDELGSPATGLYTFTVTDNAGKTAVSYNLQPQPHPVPAVDYRTLRINTEANGDQRFSWAPVVTDLPIWYSVGIWNASGLVYSSSPAATSSVVIPNSALQGPTMFWVKALDGSENTTVNNLSTSVMVGYQGPEFDYAGLADADQDGFASNVDPDDNDAKITPPPFVPTGTTGTASGTYSYNPATGALVMTWGVSTFLCEGPDIGVEAKTITLTTSTMTWPDNGGTMSWTRTSAPSSDIVGTWTWTASSGNSYIATFDENGTLSVNGTIYQCGGADTIAPSIPTGLAVTPASATQLNLTWTASSDAVGVTGYRVYRYGTQVGSPSGTSFSDTGLTAATGYSYTVAACDAATNCSLSSGAVFATTSAAPKVNQTISFGSAPAIVVDGNGAVSASATSNLAVAFSSQTLAVCTVSGNIVTGVTVGTCTIAADQGGDAYYSAAPQVTQNIAVTAKPVPGLCGTSNGGTFTHAPATDLCGSTGTVPTVTGSGPWNWSCTGTDGGTNAGCAAAKDVTGPTLMVSSLADGAITNNATLNVAGTVEDASGVAGLLINNAAISVTTGGFSYPVFLQAGPNTITTVATDTLGNSTIDTRTITLDIKAPELTVTSPADNSKTARVMATITGTIDETSTVSVTVNNGTPQSASITGSDYSVTVNLSVGLNTIAITATDLAGNTSAITRTVTYDNTLPSLAVTDPSQDITTAQSTLTLGGTVSDTITATTVAIGFLGQTLTPPVDNGGFSQQLSFPAEGTFTVVVTATDEAGNTMAVTRNIIYVVPANGSCGTSNNASLISAPTDYLCNTGAFTAVTGTGPWSWKCEGSNGGTTADCSANVQSYLVAFNSGGNGTVSGTVSQNVLYGGNATSVTADPAPGYHFVNWTGTGGFLTTAANPLTLTNVKAAQTVTANFAIDPPVAAPASITVPATSANGNYTVSWTASPTPGATYVLRQSSDPNFGTYTETVGAVSPVEITGKGSGTYYYRVKAVKTPMTDSAWVSGQCAVTLIPPATPAPAAPLGASGINPNYTFSAVSGASEYSVYLWDNTAGTGARTAWIAAAAAGCPTVPGTCTIAQQSPLVAGRTYFWNVSAKNGGGLSPASASLNFTAVTTPVAPTPLAPLNTGTTTPNYTFSAVSGASEYSVYLLDSAAGTGAGTAWINAAAAGCSKAPGTCTIAQQAPLTLGKTYQWSVSARNVVGTSPAGGGLNFTVVAAPAAPAPVTPLNTAGTTPNYLFSAVSGAAEYSVYLWDNAAGTGTRTAWINAASANCPTVPGTCSITQSTALTLGRTYFWNVSARNVAGTSPTSGSLNFTAVTAPVAPVPATPLTTAGTTSNYTFSAVSGAAEYSVYLWDNAAGTGARTAWISAAAAGCPSVPGTCAIAPPTALTLGKAYSWNVSARNGAGASPASPSLNFAVVAAPIAPTPIAPQGGGIGITPNYTFTAISGATEYSVYLRDTAAGTSPSTAWIAAAAAGCPTAPGTCTITQQTPLTIGKTYEWSVSARNVAGAGPASIMPSFTVIPAPVSPAPATPLNTAGTTPNYTFGAVSGAAEYSVYLWDNVAGSGARTAWISAAGAGCATVPGTCTIAQPTALPLGKTYSWNVSARNGSGTSPASGSLNFAIVTAPVAPVPATPLNSAGTTPNYTFSAVSGASEYSVYLWDNAAGTGARTAWITAAAAGCPTAPGTCTIAQPTALTLGKSFSWNVSARNGAGASPASGSLNFTAVAVPVAPVPATPLNSAGTTLNYTFSAVSGAAEYSVYLWDNAAGTGARTVWITAAAAGCPTAPGTCTVAQPTALTLGKAYSWNVSSRNGAGTSPASSYLNFTAVTAPVAPTPVAPLNTAGTTPNYTFGAVSGAAEYSVYLWDNTAGTGTRAAWISAAAAGCPTAPGTCTIPQPTALTLGRTYFWYVNAKNGAGTSPASSSLNFTVVTAPAAPAPATPLGPAGTTPIYTFSAVSGASEYSVYLLDIAAGTGASTAWIAAAAAGCPTAPGTCAITQQTVLTVGKTYQWSVSARNVAGAGPASTSSNFTVIPAPVSPVPTTPLVTAGTIPNYTFSAVSGASDYSVYLWDNTAGTGARTAWFSAATAGCPTAPGTCTITQPTALTLGKAYFWNVSARNGSGISPASSSLNFNVVAVPVAPVPATPLTTAGTASNYTFSAVSGAAEYSVYLWDNAAGTGARTAWISAAAAGCPAAPGTCSIAPPTAFTLGKAYSWNVSGRNGAGTSPASPSLNFAVVAAPIAPTPGAPQGGGIGNTPNYTFSAVSGATEYSLYLLDVAAGTGTGTGWISASAAGCPAAPGTCSISQPIALSYGKTYQWSVSTRNVAGASPASSTLNFAVLAAPVAPTPGGPQGGGIGTTPNYTFSAVTGAAEYSVYLRDVAAGTGTWTAWISAAAAGCPTAPGTCTITQPTALTIGKAYEWSVSARNVAGASPASSSLSFTLIPVPVSPAPVTPLGTVGTIPNYNFSAISGAVEYSVYLWDNTAGTGTRTSWITAGAAGCPTVPGTCTITQPTELTLGKTYFWNVSARNGSGSSPASGSLTFTAVTAPVAPAPATPLDTAGTTPTFSFSAVTWASEYSVYLWDNSAGTGARTTWITAAAAGCPAVPGTCTIAQPTPLTVGKTYLWNVSARNGAGASPISSSVNFTAVAAPGAPAPAAPSGPAGTTPGYTFSAVSGATQYSVYLRDVAAGTGSSTAWISAVAAGCPTAPGTCTVAQQTPLTIGKTYEWSVSARNVAGAGPASASSSFTVIPAPVSPAPAAPLGTAGTTPNYTFGAVTGASEYSVYLWDDVAGTGARTAWISAAAAGCPAVPGTCTVAQPTALLLGKTYAWNVSARNGSGISPASGSLTFAVVTAPVSPAPATPLGTAGTTPNYTFSAVSGASEYSVYLWDTVAATGARTAWISAAVAGCPSVPGTCTIGQPTALPLGRAYSWNVSARNGAGASPVSNSLNITVVTAPVAPAPATPSGTSGSAPSYIFSAVSGAVEYSVSLLDVAAGTNSGTAWISAAAAGCPTAPGTCTITQQTALTVGKTYKWSASARNGAGVSPAGSGPTFTVLPVPVAPVPATPLGAAGATPNYVFSAVSGASAYSIYLWDNAAGTGTRTAWITAAAAGCPTVPGTCSITQPTALTIGKTYVWKVSARNGSDVSPASAGVTFTAVSGLAAPTGGRLSGGVNRNFDSANFWYQLSFRPVFGATEYSVDISDNTTGAVVTSSGWIASESSDVWDSVLGAAKGWTFYTSSNPNYPGDLTVGRSYTWSVSARNVNVTGPASAGIFNYAPFPEAPTPGAPQGISSSGTTPNFMFSAVSGASEYSVYLWDSAVGTGSRTAWISAAAAGCPTAPGTCTIHQQAALATGNSYSWNVSARNFIGTSEASASLNFTVAAQASQVIAPKFAYVANGEYGVSVYRINQATGALTLSTVSLENQNYQWVTNITVDPSGTFAYVATNSSWSVYRIDQTTGALSPVPPNENGTQWQLSSSVSFHPSGKFAYEYYSENNWQGVTIFTLDQATGQIASAEFMEIPALTSIAVHPFGQFAYVSSFAGLGGSIGGQRGVLVYNIDRATGSLTAASTTSTEADPLSVTVAPSGKFVYATFMDGSTTAYSVDQITGALTAVDTQMTYGQQKSFNVHPSGKFVYIVDDMYNQVRVFSLNQTTGALTAAGTLYEENGFLNRFTVDSSGKFAYAGVDNMDGLGSSIRIYSIDPITGDLTLAGTTSIRPYVNSITTTTGFQNALPGRPTIGTATAATGSGQATVSFTPVSVSGGTPVTGYTVVASPGGLAVTGTASPLTITGLTNGTAYTFTVTANNSAGTGPASSASNSVVPTLTVKAGQSVGFGAVPTIYAGETGQVFATATSGLPVKLTSATPAVCTIAGSTVTGVTVGTCAITADQSGSVTYNAAPQAIQFISIAYERSVQTASLSIPLSIAKGGTGTVSATATSGFTVSLSSLTPSVCSISGNVVTGIAFGNCTIAGDQAGDAFYRPAPRVTGVIGIGSQTIDLTTPFAVSVGSTGTFLATATSGLAVSVSSATPDVCFISGGNVVTALTLGTCTITAGQAGNPGYQTAAPVSRDIAVKVNVASAAPKFAYVLNVQSPDLLFYTIDPITSALTAGTPISTGAFSPQTVTVDPSGRFVYLTGYYYNGPDPVNVGQSLIDDRVRAYSIHPATGALTAVNELPGCNSSAITVDPTGKFAYCDDSNISSEVSVYSIDQVTGALAASTTAIADSYYRSIAIDPSGRFFYATDPGYQSVSIFNIDQTTGTLYARNPLVVAGPTSVTVEPTGKFVYVSGYGKINVYRINQTGDLVAVQELASGQNSFEIQIDPSGRFAFVRTADELSRGVTVYTINQFTGALTAGGSVTIGQPLGLNQSDFAIDPSGQFIYYASPGDDKIYVYAIDQFSGTLTATAGVPPADGYPSGGTRSKASIAVAKVQ